MDFEKYKNLTYGNAEPKEKVNTHWMSSINDGNRFCIYRKLYQYYETWWPPLSDEFKSEIEYKRKLKKLDHKIKHLESRKQTQRALKKLWNDFEKICKSPEETPVVGFL